MIFGQKNMKSANGGEVMSDITQSEFVFDAGINDFEANVINASMEKPIIVDFWAPWCGPCKQLPTSEVYDEMVGNYPMISMVVGFGRFVVPHAILLLDNEF